MQNGKPNDRLVRFIEHVINSGSDNGRKLNVLHVRLECRTQRLMENSDWPARELDLIEQEAASYGDETDLTQVLSGAVQPTAIQDSYWLHSPSPFAWM